MFEKRMSYVNAYKTLVDRLSSDKIFVLDKARGWALSDPKGWGWVFIDASLGRRRRLFALAHEAGHFYCWPRYGQIKKSKTKLRSENRANEFALRVCKLLLGRDVSKEYKAFKKSMKDRRVYLWNVYSGQELNIVKNYSIYDPDTWMYDEEG